MHSGLADGLGTLAVTVGAVQAGHRAACGPLSQLSPAALQAV